MADKLDSTTDATFEQDVLKSSIPVLVDFWATWCGPCRALAPHLEKVAGEVEGKVKIVKLNTESDASTAQNYAVTHLPTLLMFKDGEVIDRVSGNPGPKKLRDFVNKHAT